MARTNALDILESAGTAAKLAESYGKVVENLEKSTISSQLKNTDLSGDPTSGSVEAKRIANTSSSTYGTARTGGAGTAITAPPVVINIDTNKEIINEVEEKDLTMFGVDGLIAKKTASNEKSMRRELERAFFSEAGTNGTTVSLTKTTIVDKVEELIQSIETTSTAYVDGVERDEIAIVLKPSVYGALRSYLDTNTNNANVNTATGEMGYFHGVAVYSSVYLPSGYDMIGMAKGAIAQPVRISISNPAKIPLSDAYAFGIFFYYGTKIVMSELVKKVASSASV